MNKSKVVIIVAGGKGERMQTIIPKQFIEINGKPILMHTIETFTSYDSTLRIILVLPSIQIEFWNNLCKKYAFAVLHQIVEGGDTRFISVQNGLKLVETPALIAIHDGVRPFVSRKTIATCFEQAAIYGTAIPVIDVVESIRQVTQSGNQSVDRNAYKIVQTPQVFDGKLLKKAYEQDFSPLFTDDASVVEILNVKMHLVQGNKENIKITTEFDLKLSEIIISSNK